MANFLSVRRVNGFRDLPYSSRFPEFLSQVQGSNIRLLAQARNKRNVEVAMSGCLALVGIGGKPGHRRVGVAHLEATGNLAETRLVVRQVCSHTGLDARFIVVGMPPLTSREVFRPRAFTFIKAALAEQGVELRGKDVVRHYDESGAFHVRVNPAGRTNVFLIPNLVGRI